jgi:hypothetical protein
MPAASRFEALRGRRTLDHNRSRPPPPMPGTEKPRWMIPTPAQGRGLADGTDTSVEPSHRVGENTTGLGRVKRDE